MLLMLQHSLLIPLLLLLLPLIVLLLLLLHCNGYVSLVSAEA
jgi:hypothetical protein